MSSVATLLAALERETGAAAEAARHGELETCAAVLGRRGELLVALAQELTRPGVDAAAVSRAAASALDSDARLIAELSGECSSVRAALDEVRQARRAARGVARSDGTGRFVCERV